MRTLASIVICFLSALLPIFGIVMWATTGNSWYAWFIVPIIFLLA